MALHVDRWTLDGAHEEQRLPRGGIDNWFVGPRQPGGDRSPVPIDECLVLLTVSGSDECCRAGVGLCRPGACQRDCCCRDQEIARESPHPPPPSLVVIPRAMTSIIPRVGNK